MGVALVVVHQSNLSIICLNFLKLIRINSHLKKRMKA